MTAVEPNVASESYREVTAEGLRERLHAHLRLVQAAAEENEFVDLSRATELHQQLHRALDYHGELDGTRLGVLTDAIDYLVRVEDDEDDLRSPIGFDDDAEIIEAALARVRPASEGTGSGSATM